MKLTEELGGDVIHEGYRTRYELRQIFRFRAIGKREQRIHLFVSGQNQIDDIVKAGDLVYHKKRAIDLLMQQLAGPML